MTLITRTEMLELAGKLEASAKFHDERCSLRADCCNDGDNLEEAAKMLRTLSAMFDGDAVIKVEIGAEPIHGWYREMVLRVLFMSLLTRPWTDVWGACEDLERMDPEDMNSGDGGLRTAAKHLEGKIYDAAVSLCLPDGGESSSPEGWD